MPHALFAQRWMWTVLMAMLFTAPAMAEVRIGVVGTHNTSSMSDAGPDALLWHSSWGGGAVVEVDLTENVALVSRPMSLGKGCTAALLALPGEALHLRYLEIPLLVKLSVPGRVAPYLVAGPSLGLRHSAELIRDDYRDDHVYVEDVTHDTKTAELSLEAGVGVGLRVGRGYGFFEASWAWGLTSVSQDFGKNRGMQFRLGVTVRLGS